MKKSKKRIQRQEETERIKQMEYEDSVGIRRKRFKPTFFTLQRVLWIKIGLLCATLVLYFVYSPLLLPVFVAYGSLYYIIKHTERDANYGVKKEQRIVLPKSDSLLAIVLVCFCIGGTLLSLATTSTRSSMFEGRSEAQIRAVMEERGVSSSRIDSMIARMEEGGAFLTAFEKNLLKTLTCYTGHRELFVTKNQMALRVGIQFGRRMSPRGTPPSDAPTMSDGMGGSPPSFGSIPLDRMVGQVLSAISLILMLGVAASGVFAIVRSRQTRCLGQFRRRICLQPFRRVSPTAQVNPQRQTIWQAGQALYTASTTTTFTSSPTSMWFTTAAATTRPTSWRKR